MLAFVTLASWEVTVTVWDCSLLYHTEICTHPRLCVGLFSRRFSCSGFCNTCVFQHLGTFVFIIIIRVCVICGGLTLSYTLIFVVFCLCGAFASPRFFADVSLVYLCWSLGASFMACGLFCVKKKAACYFCWFVFLCVQPIDYPALNVNPYCEHRPAFSEATNRLMSQSEEQ